MLKPKKKKQVDGHGLAFPYIVTRIFLSAHTLSIAVATQKSQRFKV